MKPTKSSTLYNVQQEPWYSPKEVLDMFEDLRGEYGDKVFEPLFKKAREMFTGAVALLGAYELNSENKYYLQLNRQSNAPDVIAARQVEQPNSGIELEIVQLEITEFEQHFSSNNIVDFLKATKLAPNNNYGTQVIIICMVNKKLEIDNKKIFEELEQLNPKYPLYILGRDFNAGVGDFIMLSVWPEITKPRKFNVNTTADKYQIPPRITFYLGTEKKIEFKEVQLKPTTVYEILGLDKEKIYKKYR